MASRARCATVSPCVVAARRTTNRIAMARIRRPDFVRAKNGKDVPGSPGAYHTAHELRKSEVREQPQEHVRLAASDHLSNASRDFKDGQSYTYCRTIRPPPQ